MPILNINKLSVEYVKETDSNKAIRDISIDLNKNEILGIVGESGCGKSTLIKSIMRILNAPGLITSGSIDFNNQDILKMDDSDLNNIRWKKISLVKQKALNSLNPVVKIGQQLSLPYRFHLGLDKKESEEKARALLDLVKINQIHFNSYPHELSGGMRQRVVIAMALALKPKLVIMDEPTTALDVINEREIINSILDLQKELGFSIIFITHDLNLLLQFADRVCVIYDGELVDSGSADEIKSGGNHSYTKLLLDSIPKINSDIKSQNNNKKILSLNNINVKYQLGSWMFPDTLHAVNDVSFDLRSGHITSIIGESGSGKSTIAKVILGLERLNSGDIKSHITDNDEIAYNLDYRRNFQMIY